MCAIEISSWKSGRASPIVTNIALKRELRRGGQTGALETDLGREVRGAGRGVKAKLISEGSSAGASSVDYQMREIA